MIPPPRLVAVPGGEVTVREWGRPDGRPVLFLHGLGPVNSSAIVALTAEPFVAAGFRLVGVDLPGFGGSPPVPADAYEPSRLAELVWAVADAAGVDRPVLVGHSWGGMVATFAAAAQPDRLVALVLGDGGHRDPVPDEWLDLPLDERIHAAEGVRLRVTGRDDVATAFDVSVDDPFVDAVLTALVDDGSGGLVSVTTGEVLATARDHTTRARPSSTWPAVAAAQVPTLALLASVPDDARTANERDGAAFAAAVPQADVVLVDGASHQLVTDLRARFGSLVLDWLATLGPSRPA